MNFNEFCDEYNKLYRFFYKTTQPDTEQISEYFELLHELQINDFKKVCRKIKENEDALPKNVVAYINNSLADENERQATGEKKFFTNAQNSCSSCCNGWVIVDGYAKYCLCAEGQRLKTFAKTKVQTATHEECAFTAKENNSGIVPF